MNNTIYLFGGQDENETRLNDLYAAQIIEDRSGDSRCFTVSWRKETEGKGAHRPSPRGSTSLLAYRDRFLVLIGGEKELPEVQEAGISSQRTCRNGEGKNAKKTGNRGEEKVETTGITKKKGKKRCTAVALKEE